MRRLIINADDFGLTAGINRAILKAHQDGIVTSATLMANGLAFDHAVALTASAPRLSVGCHIVLVDGAPMLQPSQVPTLLEFGAGARFRRGAGNFAWRAITGRINSDQIQSEAVAQIRKLQTAGISVSHVDTHKHTHILPKVLQPLLRAARTCGVRRIRNPFEPLLLSNLIYRPSLWRRWMEFRALHILTGKFREAVAEAGMTTTDGTIGMVATGGLDQQMFAWLIHHLPAGTWEFVCHPGYDDPELRRLPTHLLKSREKELEILTAPAIRELLERNQVELISYNDLP